MVTKALTIDVDMDGVLVDQITPVLPIVKKRYNVALSYNDIIEWELPVGETDIKEIIEECLRDKNFTINMPIHEDALDTISRLSRDYEIHVLTSKEELSDEWSREWLRRNKVIFSELINCRMKGKAEACIEQGIDILIDDRIKNLIEFLLCSNGIAIRFVRPWNSNRCCRGNLPQTTRLLSIESWKEIPNILRNQYKL